jgi:hypothetical protein
MEVTLYSIEDDWSLYFPWPAAFVLLAVGSSAWIWIRLWRDRNKQQNKLDRQVHWFFGTVWTIVWAFVVLCFVDNARARWALIERLNASDCQIIEGVVSDFRPLKWHEKGVESFVVADTIFEYSNADLSNPGMKTQGLVTNGMNVRVFHVDGKILRLVQVVPKPR